MKKNDNTELQVIIGWIVKIISGFTGMYLLINLISGIILVSNPDSIVYLGYDNQEQINTIKEAQFDIIKLWIVSVAYLLSLFYASIRMIQNKKYGLILYTVLSYILAIGMIVGVVYVWSDMQNNIFGSGIPYDVNPNKLTILLRGSLVLVLCGLIIITNIKLTKFDRINKATTAQQQV